MRELYHIRVLGGICNGAEKKPEVWDGVIYRQTFGFLDGKLAKAGTGADSMQDIIRFRRNNFQPELDV